jgi:glycolate oxidase iron-sulfur subunit
MERLKDTQSLVDYAASLDCIHCGLCLRTCPTYRSTGAEQSSPRGRIYLMRAVAEGQLSVSDETYRHELDFCLVCRHCESVCPAGVRFGEMMELARDARERAHPRTWWIRLARWFGLGLVLPSRARTGALLTALRLARATGLLRLLSELPGGAALRNAPRVPPRAERTRLPERSPAQGKTRGTVVLLEGCVMPHLFGRSNKAAARVLQSIGFEVCASPAHACCGALHAHNGDLARARELARHTIETLNACAGDSAVVVVPAAGCSAHMKGYGHLLADDADWKERARRLAARVQDFAEFAAHQWRPDIALRADAAWPALAYDDPCHACHGQGIRAEPRQLLDRIRGLRRVEMEDSESCCGSAGLYSLLRPADSQSVFAAKLEAFRRSGAGLLVTANPGCQLQWQQGFARAGVQAEVLHLAEVLDRARSET